MRACVRVCVCVCVCQVENLLVGAPCGLMDQVAVTCGRANQLLALLCQPATLQGFLSIPGSCRVWGIDSGARHSVGGSDYGSVRAAAFMGRQMVRTMIEEEVRGTREGGGVGRQVTVCESACGQC